MIYVCANQLDRVIKADFLIVAEKLHKRNRNSNKSAMKIIGTTE